MWDYDLSEASNERLQSAAIESRKRAIAFQKRQSWSEN